MDSKKNREEKARQLYNFYWESYIKGDLESFSSTLDEEYEMIGTSESQIAHNKAEGIAFFKAQLQEVVGKADMRNRKISTKSINNLVLINESCDIYVYGEPEWTFYSKIRISTFLRETESGWKVLQQHGSLPDMRVQEGETMAIEKVNRENLELRDAIKRRTIELENKSRELEIEASLERVRAVAMGMKNPDDMLQVCRIIASQLDLLGVKQIRNVQTAIIESKEEIYLCYQFFPGYDQDIIERTEYPRNPVEQEMVDQMLAAKDNHFIGVLKNEELKDFREHRKVENYLTDPLLDEVNELGYCFLSIGEGGLGLTLYEPLDQQTLALFKRFHQVFSLAYQRFRDIQKAEAQVREAQIEAALERVRSASIGMHTSDQLQEVINLIYREIIQLGITVDSVNFQIFNSGTKDTEVWAAAKNDHYRFHLPYIDFGPSLLLHEARERGKTFIELYCDKNEMSQWWSRVFELSDSKNITEKRKQFLLNAPGWTFSVAMDKNSGIQFNRFNDQKFTSKDFHVQQRFAKVFDQTYTRFLDLQKAEAQTRESEIQLALERVRARTMAMQHSDELAEASMVLDQQIRSLGIRTRGCAFHIYGEHDSTEWFSSEQGTLPVYHTPRENIFLEYYEAGHRGESIYIKEFAGEACAAHYDYLSTLPVMGKALKDLKASGGSFPERQIDHATFFKYGYLLFITLDEVPDSHDVFKRFAKVFEQTYTRFLDLEKAEAQAREGEIELALERVRARTLSMQTSEELADVAFILFEQLRGLGGNLWGTGFGLCDENSDKDEFWFANDKGIFPPVAIPNTTDPAHKQMYQAWKEKKDFLSIEKYGKDLESHYEYMLSLPEVRPFFQKIIDEGLSFPEKQQWNAAYFSNGYLLIITLEPYPEVGIFERFAKVFEQTYTRFLDLEKAEFQAKEAKVETSLERIRAQVTGMQESHELFDIVVSMRKEFISLGHEADYFWHMKWNPETYDMSMTSEDGEKVGMIISIPKRVHDEIPRLAAWEKSDSPTIALDLNGPEAWDYIDNMNKYGHYEQADPHAPTEEDILAIGGLTFVIAKTTHGEIGFSLAGQVPNPPEASIETLVRFAGVFDLAYRRFEDLHAAEKQNRKAKIELALERIRSRAMAMYSTSELKEVIKTVDDQIKELGVDNSGGAFIVINKDLEDGFSCWGSGGVGNYIRKVDIPYLDKPIYGALKEGIEKRVAFFTEEYTVDEKHEFFNLLFSNPPFDVTPMERQEVLLSSTEGYARSCAVSDYTSIFIINHEGKAFQEEENEILRQIGRAFEQAYRRFLDLEMAENQARLIREERDRLEITLQDLKAAQEQLVQQEKLASLGQLTAGIAHEIKNPLNFVNNFSDLSSELIEEVFAELENMDDSDPKEEIIAILNDVKSNLTKVHEHGSRADGIVTSMLQHSRASGSKREAKPFNPLVQEFVNLSFHGMRAGKAPINVDIDLQLDPKVGEVSLISEDFSRVILNLCNNAFDAMRDKLNQEEGEPRSEAYLPKLTMTTALQKDKVILTIEDNGGGIPKEIQDKILQPFFTTKKGTEGTGLGLSITNDIIKAHGGSLQVGSTDGAGTEMTISLPLD